MSDDIIEALRSAHELCEYLWHNTDATDPESGNVEVVANSEKHAETLAALLNDARTKVVAALENIEQQQADVGRVENPPHGPVSERLMRKFYGPRK